MAMGGLSGREPIYVSDDNIPEMTPIAIETIMPEIGELNAMLAEWKRAPEYKLRWKPFYERFPNWREMITD